VVQVGACEAVAGGDTQGNVHSSYPLADDGNYKFWVRGGGEWERAGMT
jgi:hypothetical protein